MYGAQKLFGFGSPTNFLGQCICSGYSYHLIVSFEFEFEIFNLILIDKLIVSNRLFKQDTY